jgi:hypothetical protein
MKSLFCRISKVDEEKRLVTGIGASEALDAEGEIFDYDTSKPYIEQWSADAKKRSKGKSYGNIREMHQPSAVGKLAEPVILDDTQKLVILTAYIGDDAAWAKCLTGIYTGFSICGPVVGDKWSDPLVPGAKRYTCSPIEFSVCDLPCNGEATFTAVKAGGITEERKFKTAQAVEEEPVVAKKTAVEKSMYSISDLASVISGLRWTQEDLAYEAEYEGDGSPIPDKLKSLISELCDVLVDLAREESSELVTALKAAGAKVLAKRFAPTEEQVMVAKVKKDPIAKCTKALASIGECLGKMCAAHEDATDAIGQVATAAEGDDPKKSAAQKAAEVAAEAAPTPTQGASPETGAEDMNEAEKAQIAAAEKNSAEALEIAKANAEGLKNVATVLEKMLNLIAGQPVAPKSAGAGAEIVVANKSAEMAPAAAAVAVTTGTDPESIAKSIRSKPHFLSEMEASSLNLGR